MHEFSNSVIGNLAIIALFQNFRPMALRHYFSVILPRKLWRWFMRKRSDYVEFDSDFRHISICYV